MTRRYLWLCWSLELAPYSPIDLLSLDEIQCESQEDHEPTKKSIPISVLIGGGGGLLVSKIHTW